nr:putative inactive purple acid phosphatase 2 [Quercus suber]
MKWILRDIEALSDKPAFISHIGDISYARGYSWSWDHFFTQIEPVASKVAYHVCIGNHEYDWPSHPWRPKWSVGIYGKDGGGECGVPFSFRFRMPGNSLEPNGTRAPDTRTFTAHLIWGQYILYERFCPMNNFTCGSLGLDWEDWEAFPVHIVIGMGGQYAQSTWEPRPDHPDDPIFPQPKRSLYRRGVFGYTRLVATKEKLQLLM